MLDNQQRKRLESLLVEFLLDVRAGHLASSQANPLKHWEQIENAILMASKTSGNLSEWATKVASKMGLSNLNSGASVGLRALVSACDEYGSHLAILQTIESEHSYLMALTRGSAEARKDAREAAASAKLDKETVLESAERHGILE